MYFVSSLTEVLTTHLNITKKSQLRNRAHEDFYSRTPLFSRISMYTSRKPALFIKVRFTAQKTENELCRWGKSFWPLRRIHKEFNVSVNIFIIKAAFSFFPSTLLFPSRHNKIVAKKKPYKKSLSDNQIFRLSFSSNHTPLFSRRQSAKE